VGGRILFYNFYFPKAKLLMTILFLSIKEVSSNAPNMTFLSENEIFNHKYRGRTQIFSEKCNFYKIKKMGVGKFLRGGWG
jgi:hypothetical protein